MKRFLLLVLFAIVVVSVALFTLRRTGANQGSIATAILSGDTVFFLHIPDTVKNSEEWHQTELYALYREPAVQEFLQKPKAEISKKGPLAEGWRDAGTLRMRDVFLASNTLDSPRLVGGFEFRCDQKEAERVIEAWKTRWIARSPGAQRSAIQYERHAVDVIKAETLLASTFVGNRFLAASTVEDLKALLDRLDHRVKTPALNAQENYRAAMKEMPARYAWMFYLQPRQFAQKLATLRSQNGRSLPDQQTMLERIQSFSHAMVFQGTKIKDVDFVAMPQLVDATLTRETLSIASTDTFLYIASLLNLQQQIDWIQQTTTNAPATPALQQINSALAAAGVSSEDWKQAFAEEISLIVNWPTNTRIPNGVITLAVKDSGRANKIVHAIANASGWQSISRNNAQYYSAPAEGNFLVISPTLAVNDRLVVFGLDAASVDRAMQPTAAQSLAATDKFKVAAKLLPEARQMFVYLDLATLYLRLDASLRPILQMTAAFVPKVTQEIDPTKLPNAEVISRHLSPIVASQSYAGTGYRSESIGPITITQTVGVAAMAWLGVVAFKSSSGASLPTLPSSSATPSPPTSNPSPTP